MRGNSSTFVQSSAKKCIITVAINLMQKLEVTSQDFSRVTENVSEEDDCTVQSSMLTYLTDCVEIYCNRVDNSIEKDTTTDLIPERVVPQTLDPADPCYLQEVGITCSNEKGETAGRFGWCIMCRKSASYYCKDTRYPVCSPACKLRYIEAEQNFDRKDLEIRRSAFEKKKQAVGDCISMFKSFMRQAFPNEGNTQAQDLNILTLKVSFLEIISILTQKPPEILSDEEEFLNFLKSNVLPNVIENTASSEPRIMQTSLAIFLNLIKNYRQHLKVEIKLFLDDIVIKMIDSVNNKAETKVYLIKVG